LLQQLGLEVLALGVAQVHAFEHAGPVLRLGAAGAGLDLDEAVVRVERIVEHPLELEVGDLLAELGQIGLHRDQHAVIAAVAIGLRHVEQLDCIGQAAGQPLHAADHVVQQLFLAPQLLGALGVVPDLGVFQLACYDRQPLLLGIDVKDTSAARPSAASARRRWRRSGSGVRLPWRSLRRKAADYR
jgi:hypothetical protein